MNEELDAEDLNDAGEALRYWAEETEENGAFVEDLRELGEKYIELSNKVRAGEIEVKVVEK